MNATETLAAHIQQTAKRVRTSKRRKAVMALAAYVFLAFAAAVVVAGATHLHAAAAQACEQP